ncbi:hypothetical protein M2454_001448, partial [Aequitasia blattaphilus]
VSSKVTEFTIGKNVYNSIFLSINKYTLELLTASVSLFSIEPKS